MILYLTHNDQPSGVYWSQVTDVVAHLNTMGGPRVRLVALVSARAYFGIRRKIRQHCPGALVLPMVPGVRRWRMNRVVVQAVCRLLGPTGIIARGALATWLALRARDKGLVKRVCFDARGAYAAEWEEYRLVDDDGLIAAIPVVEREAVARSDFRLAVSHALVQYWRERYGYAGDAHVVIPCTLGSAHLHGEAGVNAAGPALGFTADDIVLAYAGSTAGWQSFELLGAVLRKALAAQPRLKVLFLSPPDAAIEALAGAFPGRIQSTWVSPAEVPALLEQCDHGILLRGQSITNRVASPTKYAEYLACGLQVIVSGHLGDFSALTRGQGLGVVWEPGADLPELGKPAPAQREKARNMVRSRFVKPAYAKEYGRVLDRMGR